ncbi:MAG: phosphoribosyl-AMP cyclohydrolase [Candidatus Omnitrophica bacterium CG07_land_8_20_14_0_80_42_15]|uniref:Histidine biosynthesis bifunctional protein HisIE n=1 Tax=Candidatus Aquitaenariimonas noxiae TaxID=1974741 RepID=A0A2J0KVA9_9BACT|nr:MAG: phosphoribosyl-AMP cyclohydrolase [Candidatus Omnitrophica bacterium CG07_land_8_20_14_0_80_42_15]
MENLFNKLHFNASGLIPAIIQDAKTKQVLTLCYMNREALSKTLKEGKIFVFRRSLNRLMVKGETSGHFQFVKEIYVDCHENSLLFKVVQKVAACHKGYFSCYFTKINENREFEIVGKKVFEPRKERK